MKAGIGRVCITPPLGLELAGYGYDLGRKAASVLDDLYVTCLALEAENRRGFIINCDLLGLSLETVLKTRERITDEQGVSDEYILFLSTHTHTGPAANDLVGCGERDNIYVTALPGKMAEAAALAVADLKPVNRLLTAVNEIEPVGYNRTRQDGPEDHFVRGFVLEREGGKPIAAANYGCHPVTLGQSAAISADYPGRVCSTLRQRGYEGVFFTGVCGDIDPVSNKGKWGSGTEKTINEYGLRIAEGLLENLHEACLGTLEAAILHPVLPLEVYDEARVHQEAMNAAAQNPDVQRVAAVWQDDILARLPGMTFREESTVHAMRFGDVLVTGISYEVFTDFGIVIRKAFPEMTCLVCGNGESTLGYLPTTDDIISRNYASIGSAFIYRRLPPALSGPEAFSEEMVSELRRFLYMQRH